MLALDDECRSDLSATLSAPEPLSVRVTLLSRASGDGISGVTDLDSMLGRFALDMEPSFFRLLSDALEPVLAFLLTVPSPSSPGIVATEGVRLREELVELRRCALVVLLRRRCSRSMAAARGWIVVFSLPWRDGEPGRRVLARSTRCQGSHQKMPQRCLATWRSRAASFFWIRARRSFSFSQYSVR